VRRKLVTWFVFVQIPFAMVDLVHLRWRASYPESATLRRR
jgi:hypothetical protein